MSGEAYRWTAKTPSELYHTLGPHGVDHLVRQMLDVCWRQSPDEGRSLAAVKRTAQEVFDRNMRVWASIKQPSPAAFFEDLLPNPADGFMRQAMVMCWMMMPRTGGRKVSEVRAIVGAIYQRNITAWDEDEATFTGTRKKPAGKRKTLAPRAIKKTVRRTTARKRTAKASGRRSPKPAR